MHDPWCFEIPLSRKPTFSNMSLDLEGVHVADRMSDFSWDFNKISMVFGSNSNSPIIERGKLELALGNSWVWFPISNNKKISSTIYNFYNSWNSLEESWEGWKFIWKLYVAPRAKFFTWLLMHGRIKAYDFFYSLNIGQPLLVCFVDWCYKVLSISFVIVHMLNAFGRWWKTLLRLKWNLGMELA